MNLYIYIFFVIGYLIVFVMLLDDDVSAFVFLGLLHIPNSKTIIA